MESIEKWLFPGTPVSTVLRVRPMAISIFEKYGLDPWQSSPISIETLCGFKGVSLDTFITEMKALPEPGPDTDWKNQSIIHLLDFLTSEHWHFLNSMLPSIKHALAEEYAGNWESLRRLRYLVEEWPGFSTSLEEHIREEETFLYPKILQYDYCLRHKGRHPDLSGGSVNVYVALRMLGKEMEQMTGIRRFLNEVVFSRASLGSKESLEARLQPLLEDLQTRLLNHAGLESKVLFPMAKAVEKALVDAQISGEMGEKKTPLDFDNIVSKNWKPL